MNNAYIKATLKLEAVQLTLWFFKTKMQERTFLSVTSGDNLE